MNYGLYLSAAGVLTGLHRQDVVANNLANVNSVGFKPDLVYTNQRLPERLENPGSFADSQALLEQLGGGLFLRPTEFNLTQGALEPTRNPLDLAIEGDGFFTVSVSDRGAPADRLRFTRDGRFTRDASGYLAMSTTGHRVLDDAGQPVRLNDAGKIDVDGNGDVRVGGRRVARLGIVATPDQSQMTKDGHGLFRFGAGALSARTDASGAVRQGFVESSAVDPIMALNELVTATKFADASAKLMQYHDNILGQAVNTLGRVT